MSRRILILAYHHVGAPPQGFLRRKLWVTPMLLALHVGFLRALGYEFTTISQAMAARSGRFACATFDDGFADVFQLGYPALRALDVPATFYPVTDEVGRRGVAFAEDDGTCASDMAGWDDLRALAAAGWEIGSHSATHRRLARLPVSEQRALLTRSRDTLERELGSPPRSLAYPYGSYCAETIAVAREAGFETALTTRRGLAADASDPMQLPRVTIGGQRWLHAARLAKLLLLHARLLPVLPRRSLVVRSLQPPE
jgi:peptidoglycan/xylan/chitin deacetylase (PgdA/CDA1 family)